MKLEQKNALGWVILRRREELGLTQEHLAQESGVNLRTLQRAEKGQGIGKENLAALAVCFKVEVKELMDEAAKAGAPPPGIRVPLKRMATGMELLEVLERCIRRGWTLETGPLDEHRYNEMLGEDIQMLAEDLEKRAGSEDERLGRVRNAQAILSFSRKMGFWLFAGNYTEEIRGDKGRHRRRGTLVIAAPVRDPRIVPTAKGPVLDVVRDSRRMLVGAAFAGHGTSYDWLEDQLISKSDGEFRVKQEFRRILSEVMAEMMRPRSRKESPRMKTDKWLIDAAARCVFQTVSKPV